MPRELTVVLPPSATPPAPEEAERLRELAARRLNVEPATLAAARLERLSFDARPRHRGWRLSLVAFEAGEPLPPEPTGEPPTFGAPAADAPHVVVVGSGPAGLFCALDLLAAGLRVTVLERGRDVQTRRRPIRAVNRGEPVDPDCNYAFGEGGAGTYSDGKLYTRSGKKAEVRGVLETLVAHGAPREILVSWRPHVGSNRLPAVVEAIRATILRSGGRVLFGHRAEELETELDGDRCRVAAVVARNLDTDALERLACDACVLAAGHSALDALEMARRAGAELVPKGFAMGVRIEHPQPWLDARQYGGLREVHELPASFYELATQKSGRGVYSFCMCPGGFIVPAMTDSSRVVVNGMSLSRRDSPFANSGLVVQLEPEDWCGARGGKFGWPKLLARAKELGAPHLPASAGGRLPDTPDEDPLFGVRLQLALETVAAFAGGGANRAPAQRADHVVEGAGRTSKPLRTSYRPGLTACDLRDVLPPGLWARIRSALTDFDRSLPGYAGREGQLVGVETRTSSPVRIVRDEDTLESPTVAGLVPCGEGAGYAGGIVSAALDGRRAASSLARRLAGSASRSLS